MRELFPGTAGWGAQSGAFKLSEGHRRIKAVAKIFASFIPNIFGFK